MEPLQKITNHNALALLFCTLALPLGVLALGSSDLRAQSGLQTEHGGAQLPKPGSAYAPHLTGGIRDAQRINKIIQGLTPHQGARNTTKNYRRKIRKVITYRKGQGHVGAPIIVNYNHSVDLSVYFDFNSSRILPAARPVLDDLGTALNSPKLRSARYLIAGHTDARGARGYNQWLSDERARAVANYLVYNFSINPQRLVPVGFGEETPINPRRPSAAINRRVEVSLIENDHSYAPQHTIQIRKYKFTPIK